MKLIGTTNHGFKVLALDAGEASPMQNHRGGEIAVDELTGTMYAWGIFVVAYGMDSIMKACNSYPVSH
jgi:hypothetical protein